MLADLLQDRLGGRWRVQALGVSAFCETWRADDMSGTRLFVKTVPGARADVLEAEADGLTALAAAHAVRVPAVVACWAAAAAGVLAMEWLDFGVAEPPGFGRRLGHAIAALHGHEPPSEGRFGWARDNWLGGTPQPNGWTDEWTTFLAQRRLLPLTEGLPAPVVDAVRRIAERLPRWFDDGHVPRPALIHGDLWSGNWGCLVAGEPVVFDPAVSVSDAEAELAMMELFGPPPADFWPAYRERAPLAVGYPRRRPLYQLVHLLNHARLFGGGYTRRALALAQDLLRTA